MAGLAGASLDLKLAGNNPKKHIISLALSRVRDVSINTHVHHLPSRARALINHMIMLVTVTEESGRIDHSNHDRFRDSSKSVLKFRVYSKQKQ